MYSAPTGNKNTLHQRICYAPQTIRNGPRTLETARQFMNEDAHVGGHFEHLL